MANDARLIAFHRGEGIDHKGRYLSDIWALSPFWLEHTHDYIQWLFPLPEAGRFNAFAPLLTSVVQAAFEGDNLLRQHQQRSLDVMLDFFGLAREGNAISAQSTLSIQSHIWLKAAGHNHLRIYPHHPFISFVSSARACSGFSAGRDTYWRSARRSVRNVAAVLEECGVKQSGIFVIPNDL
jgi:hypothetical protein|tara:strand:+ start:1694 stop:2236 length:543 start_codon:yes stop_codon:yes gene_type:complete